MSREITIPILNEEETLEQQIRVILKFLSDELTNFPNTRLVIADNGSTDRSPQIACRLSEEFEQLELRSVDKRGVGRALKHSWTQSTADIVGYMDLDLATDLNHLREAFLLLDSGADVVTGSRLSKGSEVIGRSLVREVTSRVFNTIVRTYFGTKFADGMCGFKFLHRKHVPYLIEMGADSDGWFFATEFLICAEHSGLQVDSLPVTWRDDPNSKAKIGKLTLEYLAAMRRLKNRLSA